MRCKWLLERDVFDDLLDKMAAEIDRQGMEVCAKGYRCTDELNLSCFDKRDCVVFWGSLEFARRLNHLAPWIPGVYCNLDTLRCSTYYAFLDQFLLNQRYGFYPFQALHKSRDFLFETYGRDGKLFIRPDSGYKIFHGQVTNEKHYEADLNLMGFYGPKPEELVLVAEPQELEKEWRLVVVNGKIVSGSEYQPYVGKMPEFDPPPIEVIAFGGKIASAGWQPETAWVMDICRTKNGDLRLIEINSFSCSCLYGCELEPIVREVSRVAETEWKEFYE